MGKYVNSTTFQPDKTDFKTMKLLAEIKKHSPKGPFIESDMAELIAHTFKLKYREEAQIKEIVSESVDHFGVGNKDEIYQIIIDRMK